jgi:hypothetical protein
MAAEITDILSDKRRIYGLYYAESDQGFHEVGVGGCTKIKAYGEPGPHCYLPFYAIYYDDVIKFRVPSTMVEVRYFIGE